MFVDYRINPGLYAKVYSDLNLTGTQFLSFRDIPMLVNKYVSGLDTLDYGSGAGKSTLYLKSLGLNVEGVDVNKEMIKAAIEKDPDGVYQCINSAQIPSISEKYDFVFSSWVLMEVATKRELYAIVKEITRVLKIGGAFIAIVCNEDTYNTDWLSENTEFAENKNLYSGSVVKVLFKDINLSIYDYFWTTNDYQEAISSAGLELIEIYKPLGHNKDGYNWINEHKKSPCSIYVAKKIIRKAGAF